MIELKNINKSFNFPGSENQQAVLKNVSLKLEANESIAIMGPSGSGKSTLLKIIGSLELPDEGEINFEKSNIALYNSKQQSKFRNEAIGFVFQEHLLMPHLNVIDNILLPLLAYNSKEEIIKKKSTALNLLSEIGIIGFEKKLPAQLSIGECQRVAVVRALINNPKLLLADEPTGALDNETAEKLGLLLLELQRKMGFAMIVVTHSIDMGNKMQKQYLLRNGALNIQ